MPYVAHEMGQYCVFPDFAEITEYAGVYKAKNFQLFQAELIRKHMGDQAYDFLMASGKFQTICYKNEIEASLRTPGNAGTQLLGLNDFPGQGTALVGVLNVFWNEKSYTNASEFSRFFGPTVPLARLPKFVYTTNDTLKADIEIAHFGPHPLKSITPHWTIKDDKGNIITEGRLGKTDIPIGNSNLGNINFPLHQMQEACLLKLEVTAEEFANDWNFWVYPAALPDVNMQGIYVTDTLDSLARQVLENGGRVFMQAAGKVQFGKDVVQYFRPVFWNTSWFQMRPPHTTGILCDTTSAALADFPTSYHSDLQWWRILNRQQVMNPRQFST